MLTLIILPISAEQQTLGTFKKGSCINLIQTCDNCTWVNFTSVVYPNGVFEVLNLDSSNQGTVFNNTFCNTSQIGSYIINTVGDLDGKTTNGNYNFYINPSGITGTDNPIGIIVPIFSLLINFFVLLFAFKRTILKNELSNFILKRSLMVFGLWLAVLNSGIMAGVAQYAGLDLTREMFLFMEIFGWSAYTAIIILIFSTIIQFMKAWKIQKKERRVGQW
jgi:hypothetical protein